MTQARQDFQDVLFNQDEEEFTFNGERRTRPKGILNRELYTASGSIDEFDSYYKQQKEK